MTGNTPARLGRTSCSGSGTEYLRCEDVTPVGSAGTRLLLAPQDAAARRAVEKVLAEANVGFEVHGPVIILDRCEPDKDNAHQDLRLRLPGMLQSRVRGAFVGDADTDERLLDALIQAEPLPVLFEQLELDWARVALAENLLFSVYHPIVTAADGRVVAYEALVRARMAETGELVGAGQLLYACERLNLQHALDERARISAIRGAGPLNLAETRLFVNFQPATIYDPELCLRSTFQAAADQEVPLDRVVFEVADTARINNVEHVRSIVDHCRSRGAGIALDDVSSGFASLQHLADLVPDYAKVDRLLVESAATSGSARQTLDSIVSLSRRLGVTTIAEGVETEAQMRVCVEAGVDLLQGYLFAYPAAPPASEAVTRLAFAAAA